MIAAVLVAVVGCALVPGTSAGDVDPEMMAKANNPLADMNAINLQNYHASSLYGVPGQTSNTLNLRGVVVSGRHIIRATLPVATVPLASGSSVSGFGDLNIFDAIVVTSPEAPTTVGVGPLLVAPTATDDALGADGSWQAGAAVVAVKPMAGGSLIGTLLTWQTDIAGPEDRQDTNLLTGQVFLTMSVGDGWYLRSTPLAVFDLENDRHLVPLGLGVGRVLPFAGSVVNAFLEPQFTVYHRGDGWPSMQYFLGLNFQFPKRG